MSEILSGICKCDENQKRDYINAVLQVLTQKNHNIPTLFNTICAMTIGKFFFIQ